VPAVLGHRVIYLDGVPQVGSAGEELEAVSA
jgi:hypothetical protein